ncbi:MAG: hypothetical protein A2Y67_00615 [Candidatus Buchananbacteria bacterium RBG_13_39_9]|uniref:Histidine-specific methyltransferase SAM-dependent domain-containing protein n=1 Tax=Candidatus Buchananbacteria bacterium RBG_13_39_9 TaxID=1797531 RepID=A0A1G1XMH7_9BACT|nr:MAG: hypothetical protein A2Y67_00615 [Candidatus Buchananbacteria bacterium RBG_13_39_9]
MQKTLSAEEKMRMNEALEKIYGPQIKARLREDLQIVEQPEQVMAESAPAAEQEKTLIQTIAHKSKDPFSYWSFFNSRYFNQTGLLTPWHIYKRKRGLDEIKKQGYESFEDVKITDLSISSIEKTPREKGWDPQLHESGTGKIRGSLKVSGSLYGNEPVELTWITTFNELFAGSHLVKYDIGINLQEQIDHWSTLGQPAIFGIAEKIMNKHHLNKPLEIGQMVYAKALNKLADKIKEYVIANCFPYEFYRGDRAQTKVAIDTEISQELDQQREEEIIKGLKNRQFDEKVFYYGPGAEKFLEILKSPEYKLSNIELELINTHLPELAPYLQGRTIYDLGAANALKAQPLLAEQLKTQAKVKYVPVDIHPAMTFAAAAQINNPNVEIQGKILDFSQPLKDKLTAEPKMLTLLGSTLGNGDLNWQQNLMRNLSEAMTAEDALLIGVHLKEDLQKVLKMYDNPAGREFVMATVASLGFPEDKIELEMVADEDTRQIKQIIHIKEYLVVKRGKEEIAFKQGEAVTIFVSQKYEVGELEQLAQGAGLAIEKSFMDKDKQFELAVLRKGE